MKKSKQKQLLDRYVFDWITIYLPRQRVNSEGTLRTYKRALNIYLEYLESIGITELAPESFASNIVNNWIQWLIEKRGNSASTCNSRLAALKSFLKYLGACDNTLRNIYFDISDYVKPVKGKKTKIQGVSKEGVKAILTTIKKTGKGLRDRAFVQIIYSAALRLNEILSLTLENVHIDNGNSFIIVIGKGNKMRTIPIFDEDVAIIKEYIKAFHGENPSPTDYLFYSPVRNEKGKLSQECMRKRIKQIANHARNLCPDIPYDIHPHQFRHARAQHFLEDKVLNLAELSKFLGHANIETTMVYLDITINQKIQAFALLEEENDLPTKKKWKSRTGGFTALRALLNK